MSLNLIKYTKQLKKKATEYEQKDINGNTSASFKDKYARKLVSFFVAIVLLVSLNTGFSETFISYVSTILSIFIGLFITALIFSFDKFYVKKDLTKANSQEKLIDTQSFNFSKQFSYLTGYNIILSIFTLVLLSISTLFPDLSSINAFEYKLDFSTIKAEYIYNFIQIILIYIQRFLVLYWLSSIIYLTIFIISSMVNYMSLKTDEIGK
ncbi:hypothetical protein [Tamlana crocina]|uniref:Beta-carotene 15,15'-monooxygenase n=1 Tax=Tamlana crocina TaxID=393006 RepID=A0ABX1DEE6_9FLAO|nr:hypothetical protein [Tamlana crocina]NJX16710.1 hypothetical protein [Tamlana crocina]